MTDTLNKPFSHSYLKTRQEIENEANAVRIFLRPVITVEKPYSLFGIVVALLYLLRNGPV